MQRSFAVARARVGLGKRWTGEVGARGELEHVLPGFRFVIRVPEPAMDFREPVGDHGIGTVLAGEIADDGKGVGEASLFDRRLRLTAARRERFEGARTPAERWQPHEDRDVTDQEHHQDQASHGRIRGGA